MNTTRIYKLTKASDYWVWLCPQHLVERQRDGFEVKESREPPHPLACDDRKSGHCSQGEAA